MTSRDHGSCDEHDHCMQVAFHWTLLPLGSTAEHTLLPPSPRGDTRTTYLCVSVIWRSIKLCRVCKNSAKSCDSRRYSIMPMMMMNDGGEHGGEHPSEGAPHASTRAGHAHHARANGIAREMGEKGILRTDSRRGPRSRTGADTCLLWSSFGA